MAVSGSGKGQGTGEPPVLTDVAIPGDVARQRGLYLESRTPDSGASEAPDAEGYLADRLRDAVRESLSEAMVRAARRVSRGDGQAQASRRSSSER